MSYRIETIKTPDGWYAQIEHRADPAAGFSVETPLFATAGAATNSATITARALGLKVTEWKEEGEE